MLDLTGKEIKAGMVVVIRGAWSKSDNGKFLVERVYRDGGFWMKKLGAKGQLLKDAGRGWPLKCYANDWKTCYKIDAHNESNATVEVVSDTWTAPEVKPVSNEIRLTVNGIYKGEHYAPCYYRYDEKTGEVTIYAKNYGRSEIPREMGPVRNETDTMTDYFDTDSLDLHPGDAWYDKVKAVAVKSTIKDLKHRIARLEKGLEKPATATHRQIGLDELCECERRLAKLTA
jgi:hypothetical protein